MQDRLARKEIEFLLDKDNGERVFHVDDVSESGVRSDFSSWSQVRKQWTEVNGYVVEGSQNSGMHRGLSFGTLGEIGNVQLEAHEADSDIHYVALACESAVGYVERTGIEEGVVTVH